MKEKQTWSKENQEAFHKAWSKMIAKAWTDPAYKEKLLKNPLALFKEEGIQVPEGIQLKIEENTDKIVHLSLPQKPHGHLSETELKKLAAGLTTNTIGSISACH
ncbi:MAG: NHLP leader peptide family RiPP precursor [Verrucomicrobia bacterium]|nr:NHLP leader peptide family RiPP precursor [Verrucomicrobiota bacterium]